MISAQQILDSRTFDRAMNRIREDLIAGLEDAAPGDQGELSSIGYKLWALRELRSELEAEAQKERRESRE